MFARFGYTLYRASRKLQFWSRGTWTCSETSRDALIVQGADTHNHTSQSDIFFWLFRMNKTWQQTPSTWIIHFFAVINLRMVIKTMKCLLIRAFDNLRKRSWKAMQISLRNVSWSCVLRGSKLEFVIKGKSCVYYLLTNRRNTHHSWERNKRIGSRLQVVCSFGKHYLMWFAWIQRKRFAVSWAISQTFHEIQFTLWLQSLLQRSENEAKTLQMESADVCVRLQIWIAALFFVCGHWRRRGRQDNPRRSHLSGSHFFVCFFLIQNIQKNILFHWWGLVGLDWTELTSFRSFWEVRMNCLLDYILSVFRQQVKGVRRGVSIRKGSDCKDYPLYIMFPVISWASGGLQPNRILTHYVL